MEELIKQYAQPLIIIAVVIAVCIIFAILLSSNDKGLIMGNFKELITKFFNNATDSIGAFNPPA